MERCLKNDDWADPYKERKSDKIWWLDDLSRRGPIFFSFDLFMVYNIWSDYPWSLTPEQKAIFDKENPFWVDYFKERQNVSKEDYFKDE
ncbi:MAG: hypothetical protein K6F84_06210 [Lachnospiraceae bacterium]|nr:hypothetical protein [Lachnospiraceae bacterium]